MRTGELPGVASDATPEDEEAWPAPPTLRSVATHFGRQFATDALVPLVLFLVANVAAGLGAAIVTTTVWSGGSAALRRRAGRAAGPLVWVSLGFVLLRGAAGLATGSDAVYFGPRVATNFLVAIAFAGSVAIRRPIVGAIAPIFYPFPDVLRNHAAYRRVFSRLTLAWAALQLANGVLQVVLLANTGTNAYLLINALVSWPATAALFVVSLRYPAAAFAREPDLADRVAAAAAAAGREPAPTVVVPATPG